MGTFLFIISILSVAMGTWKLIGIIKAGKPGRKWLWSTVAGVGIFLFLLLKLWENWYPAI